MRASWMLGLVPWIMGIAMAAGTALPPAKNLQADAVAARRDRFPILVMVSLENCPHCEIVRRSHLIPLLKSKNPGVILRQVELRGNAQLVDFDGQTLTHAEFAQRHRAGIAPIVLFFDADGRSVAEPIVGASIPDFYGAYFELGLAKARAAVATPTN